MLLCKVACIHRKSQCATYLARQMAIEHFSTCLDSVRVPLIIEDGSDHVVSVEIVMGLISVFLFSTTTISWMI
jgi:hypothetical protein